MRHQRVRCCVTLWVLAIAFAAGMPRVAQSATTIFACVNNDSGAVHFVSAGTACHDNEKLVSWNTGPAGPPVLTGGTDGNVGCIFCDGRARLIAPGVPIMSTGIGCPPTGDAPAGFNMVSVPMPAGTLTVLRVKASRVDQDAHSYAVVVNDPCNPGGTGSLGCHTYVNFPPTQHFDQCESSAGQSLHINAGDRIAIAIGDGGATFDDGAFTARFSMEFTPDQ